MTQEKKELIKKIFNSINCYFLAERINGSTSVLSLSIYDQDDNECLGFRPLFLCTKNKKPIPSGQIDPEKWKNIKKKYKTEDFIPLEKLGDYDS